MALVGPLGAGKTVFAKGLAEGLGLDPAKVASPTFVILCEYPLSQVAGVRSQLTKFAHADFYRLESDAELEAIGFDDLLTPTTLLLVEWADRFPEALPPNRLEVRLSGEGGTHRRIRVEAFGADASALAERWRRALEAEPELAAAVKR